jgi:hypothetical protein
LVSDKENYEGCASYSIKKNSKINGIKVYVLKHKKNEPANVFNNIPKITFINSDHNTTNKGERVEMSCHDNSRNIHDMERNVIGITVFQFKARIKYHASA